MKGKSMDSRQKYKVIGIMSGTSLDGIDLACCTFEHAYGGWYYSIDAAHTVPYSADWKEQLASLHKRSAFELAAMDRALGRYMGMMAHALTIKYRLKKVDFIASHGHTLFHQPEKSLTVQVGNGYEIHTATGLPVVCDFRSLDVAYGGQGAPLVPIGDTLLFHEYDVCLNLGGIANISFDAKGKRRAYDVCYVNMALNYLTATIGKDFDRNGELASQGTVDSRLLQRLEESLEHYQEQRPSLGAERFEKDFRPHLDDLRLSVEDRLATVCECIGRALLRALPPGKKRLSILCTGGGALNAYLMYRIMEIVEERADLILPERNVIDFKEALIFGFLGVLRVRNEVNTLKSVTGARRDSSGGLMIGF
jgi:anhydro-N-acetylmuramic acid kinase